jgi:hypothetical protein
MNHQDCLDHKLRTHHSELLLTVTGESISSLTVGSWGACTGVPVVGFFYF